MSKGIETEGGCRFNDYREISGSLFGRWNPEDLNFIRRDNQGDGGAAAGGTFCLEAPAHQRQPLVLA